VNGGHQLLSWQHGYYLPTGCGGGSLGGDLTARDEDIPGAIHSLDQLAYGISTAVNAQNNAGTDLNGNAGTAANPLYIFSHPRRWRAARPR